VEDAIDAVNCNITGEHPDKLLLSNNGEGPDTLGYVVWGVQSCCYAFSAGRYQNYVVAKVTDGTLTLGVKNEGSQGGEDWTGLGNTTVTYLGEIDTQAAGTGLNKTLTAELKLVDALAEYEGFYETTDYKVRPYVYESALATLKQNKARLTESNNIVTNADMYDIVCSNSDCFNAIYAAKNAYVKSIDAMLMVQDKWNPHYALMAEAQARAFDDAIWDIFDGSMGVFSADEALKAADDILVAYPCYIELDPVKSKGALEITETNPFEYELAVDGNRPNIGLNKCMYTAPIGEKNVIAFEYKCDADLEGGAMYLAHPSLSADESVVYGVIPAASEWKKAYIIIANNYGWGESTDHWIRWDLASSGKFSLSVRNMILVTEEQMKAEGGDAINPGAGIDTVVVDNDVPETFIYNVMGQRVTEGAKGIVIKGGKKFLLK